MLKVTQEELDGLIAEAERNIKKCVIEKGIEKGITELEIFEGLLLLFYNKQQINYITCSTMSIIIARFMKQQINKQT